MIGRFFEQHPVFSQRFLEILPGATTIFIITLPAWLSFSHPAVVAYLIILFDIYFLYKAATFGVYSLVGYRKIKEAAKIDWLARAKTMPGHDELLHVAIIAVANEPVEVLRRSMACFAAQDFPHRQIIVVLANENKFEKLAKERSEILQKEFGKTLTIWETYHELVPGEIIGKASNENYAAREVAKRLKKMGVSFKKITVTSCDSDSLLPPGYFSCLTWTFLNDKNRDYHFYHAPVLLYRNFWEVPMPIRLQSTLQSVLRVGMLIRPDKLIQVSTYSLSLDMLEKIGFWDADIVPEDWHLFLQALFTFGDKVQTVPIFLPITADSATGKNFWQALRSRYLQERRWAWGVTDVPYAIKKFFTTPNIPVSGKIIRLLRLLEHHVSWPVSFFILTVSASIPPLVNPYFKQTVLGQNLPRLSSFILTISTVFLALVILVDIKLHPRRPAGFSLWKTPILILQWLLMPVVSFFLSAVPALDAHARLMIGKRLEYKVTEKT
ncbi:MAG: glycosyltransferase family 2 protein [bacterium]|nr:glycosyltransferase family 2 protein [bacterium]